MQTKYVYQERSESWVDSSDTECISATYQKSIIAMKYVNFVLTQIENLLYKLNDEVNAGTDPSVPGRPVHPKNDQTNFWKSCSFYPTFNFKLFYFLPHLRLKFELVFAFGNLE